MSDLKTLQQLPNLEVDDIVDYLRNKDGLAIKVIQKSNQTKEMAEASVSQNGMALRYVNKRYWTEDLLYKAIDSNPDVYSSDIDANKMTDKLWILLYEKGKGYLIPDEYLNENIWFARVKKNPYILEDVPSEYQTKDIILYTLKNASPDEILKVKSMSIELFKELFKEIPGIICFANELNYSEDVVNITELYEYAVTTNPDSLQYFYANMQSYSICEIAVTKKPSTIEYVNPTYYYPSMVTKEDDPTDGLLKKAVLADPANIFKTHSRFWCSELLDIAIEKDPKLVEKILALLSTKDEISKISDKSLKIAVTFDPIILKFIPKCMISEELALIAIRKNPEYIADIPVKSQTQKVQSEVVKENPHLIKCIARPTIKTKLISLIGKISKK